MDPIKTVGEILSETEDRRDAIHIAIAAVTASCTLYSGQSVRLVKGTTDTAEPADEIERLGIVDPFLRKRVERDQKFWLFLVPNSVTGMRHHWYHPLFEEPEEQPLSKKSEAESWLRSFAERYDINYDSLITNASTRGWLRLGRTVNSFDELEEWEKTHFWEYVEEVVGKKLSDEDRDSVGWSCSC